MYEVLLYKILYIAGTLLVITLGNRLLKKFLRGYYNKIAKNTKTKLDDEILPLVQRLLGIFITLVGLFFICLQLGINIIGLYTGLGISTLIGAMLVKDVVANIVAGVNIMFDRPFRVGDKVKINQSKYYEGDIGEVIKIGLRRTNVLIPRTNKDAPAILVVPNKDLNKIKVYNYTLAKELSDVKKEEK